LDANSPVRVEVRRPAATGGEAPTSVQHPSLDGPERPVVASSTRQAGSALGLAFVNSAEHGGAGVVAG
ncbi:MAG: hypothetical protein M3495_22065, partial [Pseudomonadota bacterium]|nr:hypothetical protein [Pseudomonadota bacterium]